MNLAKMKKDEIIWMNNHHCKHKISYLQHPNCYKVECPDKQRVGILDIEASQLKADWGIVLCVSIRDLNSDKKWVRTITKKELFSDDMDKALVKDVIKEIRNYDRLIGYYISNMRFDIPFLRTRAVHHGLDFPGFGELVVEDLFPVIKYKFQLSRNRLDNACRTLLGDSKKTHWAGKYWLKALQGDATALKYIENHCEIDTAETKRLYMKVYNYSRRNNASI